ICLANPAYSTLMQLLKKKIAHNKLILGNYKITGVCTTAYAVSQAMILKTIIRLFKLKMDNKDTFHESRDSSMDKTLPKRYVWQKYKYYILAGTAFIAFLVYVLVAVSGGRKLRVNSERIVVADVTEAPFLDYVDAEGIIQPILTIKINAL